MHISLSNLIHKGPSLEIFLQPVTNIPVIKDGQNPEYKYTFSSSTKIAGSN